MVPVSTAASTTVTADSCSRATFRVNSTVHSGSSSSSWSRVWSFWSTWGSKPWSTGFACCRGTVYSARREKPFTVSPRLLMVASKALPFVRRIR